MSIDISIIDVLLFIERIITAGIFLLRTVQSPKDCKSARNFCLS